VLERFIRRNIITHNILRINIIRFQCPKIHARHACHLVTHRWRRWFGVGVQFSYVRQMCFDGLRSVNDFVGCIKYTRYDTPVANDQWIVWKRLLWTTIICTEKATSTTIHNRRPLSKRWKRHVIKRTGDLHSGCMETVRLLYRGSVRVTEIYFDQKQPLHVVHW